MRVLPHFSLSICGGDTDYAGSLLKSVTPLAKRLAPARPRFAEAIASLVIGNFLDSRWLLVSSPSNSRCTLHFLHPFILHSIAIMCASCNGETANGHTNGTATNGTNGTNGSSHEGFTSVRSAHNPHPTNKSPYAPVGDFLSNVSRFKIIGTSFGPRRARSEVCRRLNLCRIQLVARCG